MSSFENLDKIQDYQKYTYQSSPNQSLLKKYNIPIQHFEFDYISNATDPNELEKIIDVLRSGQEGFYPDLLKTTETRLHELRPNSRFMRYSTKVLNKNDLPLEDIESISGNLENWITNVNKYSKELDEGKDIKTKCDVKIRQYKLKSQPNNNFNHKQQTNEKRISSTDYQSWDKYDPDTEILKMDLEDERQRNEAKKSKEIAEKIKKDAEKFVISGTSFTSSDDQLKSMNINRYPTEAEAIYLSERELEKGIEFFKATDYQFALQCFTRSIEYNMNINNLNNRAVTLLKLKYYHDALNDCNKVLNLDKTNIIGHINKAEALEGLRNYEEALDCIEFVINKDPNNQIAQNLADRIRKNCRNLLKNTRMKIIEIE